MSHAKPQFNRRKNGYKDSGSEAGWGYPSLRGGPPRGPGSQTCWRLVLSRSADRGSKRSRHPSFFASWRYLASPCPSRWPWEVPKTPIKGSKGPLWPHLEPPWAPWTLRWGLRGAPGPSVGSSAGLLDAPTPLPTPPTPTSEGVGGMA